MEIRNPFGPVLPFSREVEPFTEGPAGSPRAPRGQPWVPPKPSPTAPQDALIRRLELEGSALSPEGKSPFSVRRGRQLLRDRAAKEQAEQQAQPAKPASSGSPPEGQSPLPPGVPRLPGAQSPEQRALRAAEAELIARRNARLTAAQNWLDERARPRVAGPEDAYAQRLGMHKEGPPQVTDRGHIVEYIPSAPTKGFMGREKAPGYAARLTTNPVSGAARVSTPSGVEIPFKSRAEALEWAAGRSGKPPTVTEATALRDLQRQRLGLSKLGAEDPFTR